MTDTTGNAFVGFHTRIGDKNAVDGLLRLVENGLAPMGFNALIVELNPGYRYKCYPEYSTGTLDADDATRIKATCDKHGIEVIPLFQCLSHQCALMGGEAWPLLKDHPEFCEQQKYIGGADWPNIYCHSWCASNDGIYDYIFPMMDEVIEAFGAKTLHIGIDEVFEIGEEECDLCRGKDKADLLVRTVDIIENHLNEKGIKVMMWGDRLLNARAMGYNMWEGDVFGMYPAFERISRDIVITDWHYDLHSGGYPSVGQFMEGGFTTIASFGADEKQATHFWKHCLEYIYLGNKLRWQGTLAGMLFTQWAPLTNEIADGILAGIKGEKPEDGEIWATAPKHIGNGIAAIVPKGKHFRK